MEVGELEGELELVRSQGFAEDNEEIIMGMYCLAAPLRNHEGQVEAAVSVSVPLFRLTEEKKAHLLEEVTGTATAISVQLGFKK